MRALALVVLLGCATEARAQGGVPISFPDWYGVALVSLEGVFVTSALYTGVASSVRAAGHRRDGMLIIGAAMGVTHLALGVFGLHESLDVGRIDGLTAMAAAHAAIGLWNLVMPVVALIRSQGHPQEADTPRVSPLLLSGTTARGTGRRWSGLGIEVAL